MNLPVLIKRWREVILITASIKLLLFFISIIVNLHASTNIFYPWVQWDGPHYIDLAKNWYTSFGQQSLWIVFYPLYPILIKILAIITSDFLVSAILVSLLFSLFTSIILFELTILDFDRKTALLAVWFLNIYPTSYFLQASYTESLFLFVSMASIYFFRRNLFKASGFFGALSTLTRINGILLLPVFLMEKGLRKNLIALILTPVGFLIYLLINYLTFNEPFHFFKPLSSYWHKHFDFPWNGITNGLNFISNYKDEVFITYTFEFITIFFILLLTIFIFLKIRRSYGVYMLLNLLLFTSTSFILSVPRYSLILFPIFIALATIKSRLILITISLIFIPLLIYFTSLYTQGRWAF